MAGSILLVPNAAIELALRVLVKCPDGLFWVTMVEEEGEGIRKSTRRSDNKSCVAREGRRDDDEVVVVDMALAKALGEGTLLGDGVSRLRDTTGGGDKDRGGRCVAASRVSAAWSDDSAVVGGGDDLVASFLFRFLVVPLFTVGGFP